MNGRVLRRSIFWLSLGVIVLSCASPVFVIPPPVPSPKPGAVGTIVAQTAAAAQTETALLFPTATSTPTSTPLPTRTATTTPTSTATIVFINPSGVSAPAGEEGDVEDNNNGDGNEAGSTDEEQDGYVKPPVVKPWACGISSRYPTEGTLFGRGEHFQAIWIVRNTGYKTWPKQGVDIVHHSGADLREGKPYIDIPQSVGPGGSIMIKISMVAPNMRGDYSTRWTLQVGQFDFCHLRIAFEVK